MANRDSTDLTPSTLAERLAHIAPGQSAESPASPEAIGDRLGLIVDEVYSVKNMLRLVEACLDSEQAADLLERRSIQAALVELGERINAIGEALEHVKVPHAAH